jgi:hypothetical protein
VRAALLISPPSRITGKSSKLALSPAAAQRSGFCAS